MGAEDGGEAVGAVHWRGRRTAVVGLGVSNMAVIRYLHRHGAEIVGFDQKSVQALGDTYATLRELGVELVLGPEYLDRLVAPEASWDTVFLTPGMPKTMPQLERLRERNISVSSEIGLFFTLCKAPIIGVTGSSGKTTTTTLIGEILRRGERPVYVGGNIGTPLLDKVEEIGPDSLVVLELSSFQLEMLDRSPSGAVVTNVTPNHLDVHGTMVSYVAAKRRIFAFQRPGDWVLLNEDDATTRRMKSAAPGEVLTFSMRSEATARVEKGYVVVQSPPDGDSFAPGSRLAICSVDDIALPGRHNVENVLAAATVAVRLGVDVEAIRSVVTTFPGVPHRLELVAECDGVRYYNDSIATTPARAVAGVQAFEDPVVLIAGGYDKRLPFAELAEVLPGRARAVVVLGTTAPAIEAAIRQHADAADVEPPRLRHAVTFEEAVHLARDLAEPGDVVLLSPACASFDMFPSFAARGELFRTIVRGFCDE